MVFSQLNAAFLIYNLGANPYFSGCARVEQKTRDCDFGIALF
jgi:hypothetical protein